MISDYLKTWAHYVLPKKALTFLAGMLANVNYPLVKNWLIRRFIQIYKVDMNEAISSDVNDYASFNDFFIRHLKADVRPFSDAPIISPVDGSISELGLIHSGSILQAKGKRYTVEALLDSKELAAHFHQGSFITLYLSPKDYHRVHMPIEGTLLDTCYIPGKLFSVQPVTVRTIPELFARNERLIACFETPLGLMAMVLVGATIVGTIGTSWEGDVCRRRQKYRTDYREHSTHPQPGLPKGGEMGYFKLGSTVILLFANRENAQWLSELHAGQSIKLGQALVDTVKS